MTDACLTIEAVFDAYFDCRRTKRNSTNQLRFEAELESNLVGLYRDLESGNYKIGRSIAFCPDASENPGSMGGRFP